VSTKILSITIPSYNTAKYIDECLPYLIDEAIIDEVELLIVSDGSKDDTVAVASRWAEKYPTSIKVIDKKNGGHGSTINRGIQEATGKYFKVVDGDDWVKTENLVRLVNFLRNNDVDLINNPYFEHDEQTREETLMMALDVPAGQIKVYPQIVEKIKIPPMHTVTYKTSILKDNNIRIDEKMFYVDVEYITYPLPFVKTQVYLDFPVYVYRVNSGTQSMAIGNMVKNRKMHYTMLQHQWDFIKGLSTDVAAPVRRALLQRFSELVLAQYVVCLSIDDKEVRKRETADFTAYLRGEKIADEKDLLKLSKRLINSGGAIIAPGVTLRKKFQGNQLWRSIERGLLNAVKRMRN